ncbi:prepilin-type N-terminal cleavage/methylation domain-containing protein [Cytobacillus sp. Hz8]|uniref:prepilin-type N-terminal cleavage/methylation domain-containing protein n=1 Tax=Cytobacillus sp. Hz8 TaxID=3347168 RepID=UPI0035DF8879
MIKILKNRLKNQKGFTLIELLAVIVILGIIAAIAIPSVGKIIHNSRIDAIKTDGIQIINASKTAYAETGAASYDLASLADYIDVDADEFKDTTVTVTDGVFTLSGTGTKSGVTVTFNGATVSDINKAAKGDTTIPK